MFRWIEPGDVWGVEAWSDSDWAGCRVTRKSTSGGIVMWGLHALEAYSSSQQTVALSSGEAEYYAVLKGGVEAVGLQAMCEELGYSFRAPRVGSDSSAA